MNATEQLTQCWNCGLSYVIGAQACPGCDAANANSDLEQAQQEAANEDPPGDWAAELGPLQQGDIELLQDAINALESAGSGLQVDHALHGLRKRVEAAKQEQRKPLKQMLGEVDDHLQGLQHYGHSHQLREAMSVVQDMQEALQKTARVQGVAFEYDLDAMDEAVKAARAAIARATGAA